MAKRRVKHKKKTSSRAAEPKIRVPMVSSKKTREPLVSSEETTPPPPPPPCRLLSKLPVEIRLAIYEFYMLNYIKTSSDALTMGHIWSDVVVLPGPNINRDDRCIGFESAHNDKGPPLLFVCRQITAEFAPIMGQYVSFVLFSYTRDRDGNSTSSELSLSSLSLYGRDRPPGGRRPRNLHKLSFPKRCGPSPKSTIRHLHIEWYCLTPGQAKVQSREEEGYLLTIISLLRGLVPSLEVPSTITGPGVTAYDSQLHVDLTEKPGPGVVLARLTTLRFTLGYGMDERPTRPVMVTCLCCGGQRHQDVEHRPGRLAALVCAVETLRDFCPELRTVELVGVFTKDFMDYFEARARDVGVRLLRGHDDPLLLGWEFCE